MGQSVRRLVVVTASAGLIIGAGVSAQSAAQGAGSPGSSGASTAKAGAAAKAGTGDKSQRIGGARQVPRDRHGLPRLPHASEDGPERP